jgi:hypothetical protein
MSLDFSIMINGMVEFIKKKSNKMQQCIKIIIFPYLYEAQHVSGDVVSHTVPDNVHHLHVQQPLTYEKPEGASAVLGS